MAAPTGRAGRLTGGADDGIMGSAISRVWHPLLGWSAVRRCELLTVFMGFDNPGGLVYNDGA